MDISVSVSTDCSILDINALILIPAFSLFKTSSFCASEFDKFLELDILKKLIVAAQIKEQTTMAAVIFVFMDFK